MHHSYLSAALSVPQMLQQWAGLSAPEAGASGSAAIRAAQQARQEASEARQQLEQLQASLQDQAASSVPQDLSTDASKRGVLWSEVWVCDATCGPGCTTLTDAENYAESPQGWLC